MTERHDKTHDDASAEAPRAQPDGDTLTRFLLQEAGVRGVRVHLDATWQQIRGRAEYPLAISELLGEASAASALFTAHAKIEGRLSVQLRGEGPLRTLFAECTAAGTLRGIAQVDEGAVLPRDLRLLGTNAVLAITIENPGAEGREPTRYQGMVALESDSLAEALEGYFRQSEQLPTRLRQFTCVHSLGHALMRGYHETIFLAVNACTKLGAHYAPDCAQGAFHDYWISLRGADETTAPLHAINSPRRLCAFAR